MATKEQKKVAAEFIAYWTAQKGSEKGEDQTFWNSLLGEVLGVSDVKSRINPTPSFDMKDFVRSPGGTVTLAEVTGIGKIAGFDAAKAKWEAALSGSLRV